MGKKILVKILLILGLQVSMLGLSHAGTWDWLKDTPINHFTPKDLEILKLTARELLEKGKDGEAAQWKNPETGYSGEILMLDTSHQNGEICRKTKFTNMAEGLTNYQIYLLCQQADTTWKISR